MAVSPIWELGRADRGPLAPYAQRAARTRGRVYPEAPHPLRTDFQRDRDRIVHSQAFRRLEYKTQVFVTGSCDHFRTRLTHTIEVAGITRTIARSLGLNEDLAEAIALAHDLGHPPFGHAGERELNRRLEAHGGFDHNRQALKLVDVLEEKYPGFPGLNLTWEMRAGLVKHRDKDSRLDAEPLPPQLSLEAQVADVADDLTYYAHDLDDGLLAGLIDPDELDELQFWQLVRAHSGAERIGREDEHFIPFMIRNSINLLVEDVIHASLARLNAGKLESPDEAQGLPAPLIGFSEPIAQASGELKEFLFLKIYRHPAVLKDIETAATWTGKLFEYFLAHPADLGRRSRRRLPEVELHVVVGDYLAMMTDRYAFEQFAKFVAESGTAFPSGTEPDKVSERGRGVAGQAMTESST